MPESQPNVANAVDKSGAVGLNVALPIAVQVFGLLIPPIYLIVGCYRARRSEYRNQVWASTIGLFALILLTMSSNSLRKNSLLGQLMSVLRGYILPVVILRYTLYAQYNNSLTVLFVFARSVLSLYSFLAQPPPYTTNAATGQPEHLRILLAGDSFFPKVDGVSTFSSHTIKHMISQGHTVHVLTSKKGPTPLFGATVTRLPGIIPESIDPHHSITMPIPWLMFPAIFQFKPHVVHVFESVVPCK